MSQSRITGARHIRWHGATLFVCWLAAAPAAFAGSDSAAVAEARPETENLVIRAWVAAWNAGTGDGLESFLTEDVTFQEPFYSSNGLEGYRDVMRTGLAPFRDHEITIEDLVLDGDRGALTWAARATHDSSSRTVQIKAVSILRFRDGKIAAEWRVYDGASVLQQIGALPGGDGGATSE